MQFNLILFFILLIIIIIGMVLSYFTSQKSAKIHGRLSIITNKLKEVRTQKEIEDLWNEVMEIDKSILYTGGSVYCRIRTLLSEIKIKFENYRQGI